MKEAFAALIKLKLVWGSGELH